MSLPPFGKTVKIRFWSLRNGLGANLGVVFDIDTQVERECYRKRTSGGWKWQIKNLRDLMQWDWCAETDQEILDDAGESLEFELVTPPDAASEKG